MELYVKKRICLTGRDTQAFIGSIESLFLIDGKLIGAVAEERLGKRLKHDSSFPKNSIKWLLKESNIKYSDINVIAVSNNSLSNLPNKFFHSFDFSIKNLFKKIKSKIFNNYSYCNY